MGPYAWLAVPPSGSRFVLASAIAAPDEGRRRSLRLAGAQTQFFPKPGAASFKRLLGLMPFRAGTRYNKMRRYGARLEEAPVLNFFVAVTWHANLRSAVTWHVNK